MEHCNCGEPCFTFTKFTQDKKFLSKRCGSFSDSKKKKKCDYKEDTFICDIIFPQAMETECNVSVSKKKDLRTQLNHYIHLYEISTKTGNISANINFILKQMNYKLFFDTVENIQDLKKRLELPPDNIITFKHFKPVVLVEVPEYLKVIPEKTKEATKKHKEKTYKMSTTYLRPTSKKHDSESERDSDSDSDVDENGGFDIENYDTDDNQDDFYDDGNFSD
jgi:hypothetical protein